MIFYNIGPGTAYVAMNSEFDFKLMPAGATHEVDFTRTKTRLTVIAYKCDQGNTAKVLATGRY